jgi:hypothetical protein
MNNPEEIKMGGFSVNGPKKIDKSDYQLPVDNTKTIIADKTKVGGTQQVGGANIGEGVSPTKFTSSLGKTGSSAILENSIAFNNVGKSQGASLLDNVRGQLGEDPKETVKNGAINDQTNQFLQQIGIA